MRSTNGREINSSEWCFFRVLILKWLYIYGECSSADDKPIKIMGNKSSVYGSTGFCRKERDFINPSKIVGIKTVLCKLVMKNGL